MFRYSFLLVVALGASAQAQTVSYEGTTFPEQDGWTRDEQLFPADRAIENGWLVQRADVVPQDPPFLDISEQDFYRRSLSEFAGSDPFFVEWLMVADGTRTGIPSASPAALAAAGTSHAFYHFTIAEDQARFIDASLSVLLVDIAPGVPHTYRLELYGTELYVWWIDENIVDSGVPEGPYPTSSSEIVFGARAAGETITAAWDYVRYGTIPQDGSGDYDSDGVVTQVDFYFFHECLTYDRPGIHGGPENDAGPGCRFADFDSDGDADLLDFAEFQNAFGGAP